MSKNTKGILIVLGVAIVAYVIFSILKAIADGKRTAEAILMAPFRAAVQAWDAVAGAVATVADNAAAAASLPSLHAQSVVLDDQLVAMNTNDYAPGGRIYRRIANEQGTLAADRAWQNVRNNLATQQADTAAWWQLWK